MLEAINPWYWWGLAAIAAPIIIHLINRLRYRRVRWAAMEFLLKSQKRNRRRLILEQLLLLALRCLIVALFALLVVRPLWLLGSDQRLAAGLPSYHVIVLDDSLSMQDRETPRGDDRTTAFAFMVRFTQELVAHLQDAPASHYLTVLRTTDPHMPELGRAASQLAGEAPGQPLTQDTLQQLRQRLERLTCSYRQAHPLPALREAEALLAAVQEGHRRLYILSDFRTGDWAEAEGREALRVLARLSHPRGGNTHVFLYDVAHPRRQTPEPGSDAPVPDTHANVALVDVQPESRLLTPGVPVRLRVLLRNFGTEEKTSLRIAARVDGREKPEVAKIVDRLAPGQERSVTLDMSFGFEDRLGSKAVTLYVDEPDHLPADNFRYTVLELRKEIPILVVDPEPGAPAGDAAYIEWALASSTRTGVRVVRVRPQELRVRTDLDDFAVIFLLNVAGVGSGFGELDSDSLRALEKYAARGGSLVFFLGPRVNAVSYNQHLYRQGAGIFPFPLDPQPVSGRRDAYLEDPPDPEDISPRLRLIQTQHPAFRILGDRTDFLYFLETHRYFRPDPKWQPDPRVRIVARLANRQPLVLYRQRALELADKLGREGSAGQGRLAQAAKRIRDWFVGAEHKRARKGPVLEVLADLLENPELASYWAEPVPQRKDLRRDIQQFYDLLLAGDPIIIEGQAGSGPAAGTVLVFLTSAAPTPIQGRDYPWNNWATLMDPNHFVLYVPLLLDVQQYLAGQTRARRETQSDWLLGSSARLQLPADRFGLRATFLELSESDSTARQLGQLTGHSGNDAVTFEVTAPDRPGFYRLDVVAPGGSAPASTGQIALAWNVRAEREGDLKRLAESEWRDLFAQALEQELKLTPDQARSFASSRVWLTPPGTASQGQQVREQLWSWSDYAALLLVFLLLLAAEQALAVRLSHHTEIGTVPTFVTSRSSAAG